MIPREDFALEGNKYDLSLFGDFPISKLAKDDPARRLLRKPDFQRETNHWSPAQLVMFLASFVDNEVIPSLILWKSASFIFVIDGGHRLSALRAWMEDDYGDRAISGEFFGGEISDEQKRIARKARTMIEGKIGRFSALRELVDSNAASEQQKQRAIALTTRTIPVQWIQGSAKVAETSFFKINSQGTPLDETEGMLIKNRRKAVAIGARAILRAGSGHKYWSAFTPENQRKIEDLAASYYNDFFKPEIKEPLKTIELPIAGAVSPVDALSLLVEFLGITGTGTAKGKQIGEYENDTTGDETIQMLKNSLQIMKRITGNSSESLGLHPAIYFYNERGKYSRFLFLGMILLLTERLGNNDGGFFKKFSAVRPKLEKFLVENKSLIGIILQNLAKSQRVPKMRDMLEFVVNQSHMKESIAPEDVMKHLGMRGRVFDVVASQTTPAFSDNTRATIFVRDALAAAMECPICKGKLAPHKSVSYDHVVRVREGGLGEAENGALVHPYCNSAVKN